jgi:flagellar L-ring protein precursor FlgH
MPIMLGLVVLGCAKPRVVHRPPTIPYIEDGPPPPALSDGSLFQDRLFVADLHACRVNDLVTIRLKDVTAAKSSASTNMAKDGSNSLEAPGAQGKSEKPEKPGAAKDSKKAEPATSNSKFKGSGSTNREATFTTTITARVVKVMNNGNLIVEGLRDIQLNAETQRLFIAGLVDPTRLDGKNAINSDMVAELRVGYGGQGIVEASMKPGAISRLLNYIWPF